MNKQAMIDLMEEAEKRGDLETAKRVLMKIESYKEPVKAEPKNKGNEFLRQGGLALRHGLEGVAEIADIFTEPVRAGLNQLGVEIPTNTSGAVKNLISDLPQPNNPLEEVVGTASKSLAGIGSFAGTGNALSKLSQPLVKSFGKSLTAQPTMQAATSISAGASGETAKQMGADPLTQVATTIVGGGIPSLAKAGVDKVSKVVKQAPMNKLIKEASPSKQELKEASSHVYKELDDSGVAVNEISFNRLINKASAMAKGQGVDSDITPKSAKALQRIIDLKGSSPTFTEVNNLRKIAGNAAGAIEREDARIGVKLQNIIDDHLDNIKPTDLLTGNSKDLGKKYKLARELHGRYRRSETIEQAVKEAKDQASGFENGIRIKFRQLLKSKKSNYFSKEEKEMMHKVVQGDTAGNLAKLIGKMGFSESQATQLLGTTVGIGLGSAVGGTVGAMAMPLIGQLSKGLAQRMTRNKAEFANQFIRAGKNAQKITAVYMKNTPKKQRKASELKELLLMPHVDKKSLPKNLDKYVDNIVPLRATIAAPLAVGASQSIAATP